MSTAPYQITELCTLGYKYGTDKCPQLKHAYTPFYYELLKDRRESIKKVLELGVGYYKNIQRDEIIYDRGLKRYYHRGASLKMWRDFFPNALVFGADIRPETMFEDERIKTYVCDERKKEDLITLIEHTGSDIDVLIDDASHHVNDQIFTCLTLMPLLKKDVTYSIEDVSHPRLISKVLSQCGDYEFRIPTIPGKQHGGMIVVVKNKQYAIT